MPTGSAYCTSNSTVSGIVAVPAMTLGLFLYSLRESSETVREIFT